MPVSENKNETLYLLRKYQLLRSIKVRNKIVELNLGLARKESHYWENVCKEKYDDLFQISCLGLIKSVERFNIHKRYAFSSYAISCIRSEIHHYLRNKGSTVRTPRRYFELWQRSESFSRFFREKCRRSPTDAELSTALLVSQKEWQAVKLAWINRFPLSLDIPVKDEKESLFLIDCIPANEGFWTQENKIYLHQILEQAEERTREILMLVYLYDLKQVQVAKLMDLHGNTVGKRAKEGLQLISYIVANDSRQT